MNRHGREVHADCSHLHDLTMDMLEALRTAAAALVVQENVVIAKQNIEPTVPCISTTPAFFKLAHFAHVTYPLKSCGCDLPFRR